MEFVDFRRLRKSRRIDLLFPDWGSGETVAFLSPHDDDVLLGAGNLLAATLAHGGRPILMIFCSGDAGYSTPADKKEIIATRRAETLAAYNRMGLESEDIRFFDVPDFSLMPQVNRRFAEARGLFEEQVRLFREKRVSRAVFSSGHFEHWDHTAVYLMGIYTSPQAGDPILADLGAPHPVKTLLVYSVWGDFAPDPEAYHSSRADLGIVVDENQESVLREAISAFSSQSQIFQNIVALREQRRSDFGYLELYRSVAVREATDFGPYIELLTRCTDE